MIRCLMARVPEDSMRSCADGDACAWACPSSRVAHPPGHLLPRLPKMSDERQGVAGEESPAGGGHRQIKPRAPGQPHLWSAPRPRQLRESG